MTAFLAMVVVTLAGSSAASAAPKSIGGFVGGAAGGAAGQLTQPRDVAVYEGLDGDRSTDKLFVVEASGLNLRVDRLDADGNFELMWGRNVDASNPSLGYEVCTVAADCQAPSPSAAAVGTARGEFDNPTGIAVDQANGWVYVHDRGNRRVQKFDLDGNFLLMFGKGVNQGGGTPASPGDVCTAAHLAAGDVCGGGAPGNASAQLGSTGTDVRGPAIDPASGDVFVADPQNRRILQFQSDGTFLRGWGWDVDKTTVNNRFEACTTNCGPGVNSAPTNSNGAFASSNPLNITIDSNGIVYASDNAPSSSTQRVTRFSSTPEPAGPGDATPSLTTAIASPPLFSAGSTSTRGLEIDPDSDGAGPDEEHLLVARDQTGTGGEVTRVQEFDIPATPTDPITGAELVDTHTYLDLPINGLGVSAGSGTIYLPVASLNLLPSNLFPACGCGSGDIHGVMVLSEESAPLEGSIEPPADATSSSAELVGTIDPGFAVTYQFEISSDGVSWSPAGPRRYAGGAQPVEVTQLATGLEPNTSYRARIVLRRVTGLTTAQTLVTNEGLVLTDAIAPAVETLGTANRTDSSVQLRGKVDPNGSATSYRFEYGLAGGSFDFHVPVPSASAGSGNTADLVVRDVAGLLPETAYRYRIVATNASGTSVGAAVEFTTRSVADGGAPGGARAYELVSPADKVGGAGVGRWGGGAAGAAAGSGQPAHIGERYAAQGDLGSVLLDSATAFATDWAFANRTNDSVGWQSHSPVTHGSVSRQSYRFLVMQTAARDLSKVVWASNSALIKPFPELAGWPGNLNAAFIADWNGRWEIVAPTDLSQVRGDPNNLNAPRGSARSAFSADASHLAFSTVLTTGGVASPAGMAGPADPSHPRWSDLVAGRAAYIEDVGAGLSDSFDGQGVYANLGICADDTLLPEQAGSGLLEDEPCQPASERQRLSIPATGGTFALQFGGVDTAPIAYNAAAGAVQAALEALPGLEPGDVTVTGGPGDAHATTPYVVRFAAGLGDVGEISIDGSLLTGGQAPVAVESALVESLISNRGAALHAQNADEYLKNVVSRDGARTFFLSPDPVAVGVPSAGCTGSGATTVCPPQLYVRQRNGDGSVSTRWISRAVDGLFGTQAASLTGTVRFAGASEDGDKVLFETNSPLTPDDPNAGCGGNPLPCTAGIPSVDSWDLYLYDLPDGPDGDPATPDGDPAGGELTRVSGGPTGGADCNVTNAAPPAPPAPTADPAAQRSLRFLADDANRAYFTCAAPLSDVPLSSNGTITEPGGGPTTSDVTNLYAYSNEAGSGESWAFVARLPKVGPYSVNACATSDSSGTGGLVVNPTSANDPFLRGDGQGNCVRGTTDGDFVTFWTLGRLTLDDPDTETLDAYAYDAELEELTRITAPQGGPGGSYLCNPQHLSNPGTNALAVQCNGDMGFGGDALSLLGVASKPLVEGDRIAFFQTRSRLVADDVDNAYDVYEWRNGDLSLISTGNSAFDGAPGEIGGAFYNGNDETGRNVYLTTNDKLSWQDVDAVLDVYTARVGGGIPQPAAPVVCGVLAGACHGGGAATAPASAVTTARPAAGGGNATPAVRAKLVVGGLGRRAGRRAARTGVLRFRVRSERAGVVRVLARARIGRRVRRVGDARERVQADRSARIGLRLSRPARRALGRGRVLRVRLRVAQVGGRTRTATVRLARGARS